MKNLNMHKLLTYFSISDIISIFAFVLSAYAIFKTTKFNKKQETLINSQNQINNLLKEKELKNLELEKQADLNMNFIPLGRRSRKLRLYNKGKAPAYNVKLIIQEDSHLLIPEELESVFPLEILEPSQKVDLNASMSIDTDKKHKFRLVWQDEFSSENSKIVYLTT